MVIKLARQVIRNLYSQSFGLLCSSSVGFSSTNITLQRVWISYHSVISIFSRKFDAWYNLQIHQLFFWKSSREIFYWSEQRGKEFFFVENSLTVCYVDKIMNTCILLNHFRHLIWKAQRETDWWTKKASLAQYFWMKTSWNVSIAIVAVRMQNHNSDQFQPLAPYFEHSAMACC